MNENNLYQSMAEHPDIEPIMDLLDLVDPCDEFSQALCLVRDCFSPSDTLRLLSRKSLRELLKTRTSLMSSYQTAVAAAARAKGVNAKTFLEAASALPAEEFDTMRKAYEKQVNELMNRPMR